jgi:hypothetical protein
MYVGRFVAKALLDHMHLGVSFTRALYKHLLGIKPSWHDLELTEPLIYKQLQMIMHTPGYAESLMTDFVVNEAGSGDRLGQIEEVAILVLNKASPSSLKYRWSSRKGGQTFHS